MVWVKENNFFVINRVMTSEVQGPIQRFLYNLSTENYAQAEKEIKNIVEIKVNKTFEEEFEKSKKSFQIK
jgi:hypothetical protein